MIKSATQIVDANGRPTSALIKALPAPIASTTVIVDAQRLPTVAFLQYARANGVTLDSGVMVASPDGLPTREFLKTGLT